MGIDTIDSSITAIHTICVFRTLPTYRVSAVRTFLKIITAALWIRFSV